MDKTVLVKDDISEGKKLLEHLDKTKFKINSALWFYIPDLEKYKLVLATDYLKTHSLKEAYNFIQRELKKSKIIGIELENITIVKADDDLIKLLKILIVTEPTLNDIRLTKVVINGNMIEDALVFRLS
jgi:hypothetical protein